MTHAELVQQLDGLRRRLGELESREGEHHVALNALRASEEKYRVMLDESSDPVFSFYPDGRYRYVNRAFADGVGRKLEEISGRSIWEVFPKEEADKRFAVVSWVFQHGESKVVEVRVPRPDGDRYYVTTVKPILDEQGAVETVICISKEFTERRRAEEGMQLARQIFDAASEAIFVSDLEGKLLDVNAEACRLAKYSREEMLCLRNVDIVAQEDISRIAPELRQCDAGHVVENRWLLLCSDGSKLPLDLVVQRLPGDRYLAIGRDLTLREKVYKQLAEARDVAEAASLAKTRFLAAASHDLRQPIQAISLFHEALATTALTAEQKRFIDYLALATQSLGSILDELLDVSRLDAGSIAPQPEVVQADSLFRSIESEFAPLAAAKGLRFKLYFPTREMAVFTDAKLVKSLLRNLIGNAIKYTGAGGILVSIRRRDRQAVIQVWDTGIGIAAADVERIFDEYFQVGNSERDSVKGLGLGLAIVRRLARLMGTEAVCRSRPGRGSVFEFYQPLADGSASG